MSSSIALSCSLSQIRRNELSKPSTTTYRAPSNNPRNVRDDTQTTRETVSRRTTHGDSIQLGATSSRKSVEVSMVHARRVQWFVSLSLKPFITRSASPANGKSNLTDNRRRRVLRQTATKLRNNFVANLLSATQSIVHALGVTYIGQCYLTLK